jgi:hypothetical protein
MKNINIKYFLYLILGVSIITFFILIRIKNVENINLEAVIDLLPTVITVDVIFLGLFSKYLWKIKFLRDWLVPFPNLNGTWKGYINTTWEDPLTKQRPEPIPAILTIKQSFFNVSCVMRTAEMTSRSIVSDFVLDKENQVKRLFYSYDSNPIQTVKERSPQHCGTVVFDIDESSKITLKGEYWTGRKTTGDIELTFWKKEFLDKYPSELGIHPVSDKRNNQS